MTSEAENTEGDREATSTRNQCCEATTDHPVIRHCAGGFWLCLIALSFVLATSSANQDLDIERVTIAIGGPLLLIAVAHSVIGMGKLSRRRFKEGKRSNGVVLAWLTVLGSGGLGILGLFIVDMIDRNLGSRYGRSHSGPFDIDTGCVFRLAFVIGALLLFVAAGRYVVGKGQLSRRRFKEGKRSNGVLVALQTVLASGGLVILGWVIVVSIMFALFYRQ